MKKLIPIALFLYVFCACQSNDSAIRSHLQGFMQKYPEATLQDIYKGAFQDKFGPAHMLTDRESVKGYILRELETATVLEGDYYEPCGWQGNFYRINLKAIKDQKITADELTDAFMESAKGIDDSLTPQWTEEWNQLMEAIKTTAPHLNGFSQDSTLIANLLNDGKYVVHHSPAFDSCYQPHYRIVRKDVFEKNLLPKMK